jgi:Ribonuclease HII
MAPVEEVDDLLFLGAPFLSLVRALEDLSGVPASVVVVGHFPPVLGVPCVAVSRCDAPEECFLAASLFAYVVWGVVMVVLVVKILFLVFPFLRDVPKRCICRY